jgi:hypothetical protein
LRQSIAEIANCCEKTGGTKSDAHLISDAYRFGTAVAMERATGGSAADCYRDIKMTRSYDISARLAAFAASLLFATFTLVVTVGPAVPSFPLA